MFSLSSYLYFCVCVFLYLRTCVFSIWHTGNTDKSSQASVSLSIFLLLMYDEKQIGGCK